jgi:hypothetical protein
LLIGTAMSILCLVILVVVISKTQWLDGVVCLKGSTSCSFYQSPTTNPSRTQ